MNDNGIIKIRRTAPTNKDLTFEDVCLAISEMRHEERRLLIKELKKEYPELILENHSE